MDHFNFNKESYMTFQQRYVVNSKYWGGPNDSSPIFLFVGDNVDIMEDIEYVGFPLVLASRFKGLLVYIEQALADYAQIIIDVKKNMSAENCPVITVGGSYGGMLASWFRLKYPHVTYGALASSAPILYFLGLTPENGYSSIVSKDFNVSQIMELSMHRLQAQLVTTP
ncbi:hypothetical protein LXL04_032984 [Taraxacum kok-saghyz]